MIVQYKALNCLPDCRDNVPKQTHPYMSGNFVRLIDGTSAYEGTVEVFHNNRWGTVCDDHWITENAQVVCHMLGHKREGAIAVTDNGFHYNRTREFWLDDVICSGNEMSLFNCSHSTWGHNDCEAGEVAGVRCVPESYGRFIRLIDGNTSYEGTVLVFYNDMWRTIEQTSTGIENAKKIFPKNLNILWIKKGSDYSPDEDNRQKTELNVTSYFRINQKDTQYNVEKEDTKRIIVQDEEKALKGNYDDIGTNVEVYKTSDTYENQSAASRYDDIDKTNFRISILNNEIRRSVDIENNAGESQLDECFKRDSKNTVLKNELHRSVDIENNAGESQLDECFERDSLNTATDYKNMHFQWLHEAGRNLALFAVPSINVRPFPNLADGNKTMSTSKGLRSVSIDWLIVQALVQFQFLINSEPPAMPHDLYSLINSEPPAMSHDLYSLINSEPPAMPHDLYSLINSEPPAMSHDLYSLINSEPPAMSHDLYSLINSEPPAMPHDLNSLINSEPPAMPHDLYSLINSEPPAMSHDLYSLINSEPPAMSHDLYSLINSEPPAMPHDLNSLINSEPPAMPHDLYSLINSEPPAMPHDLYSLINSEPPAMPHDLYSLINSEPPAMFHDLYSLINSEPPAMPQIIN
ncbi:hypothetical protein Btru_039481 [Bulinus truncatus]|nr:hypothetical protein Btru_039481 [Bulinus truncatus]